MTTCAFCPQIHIELPSPIWSFWASPAQPRRSYQGVRAFNERSRYRTGRANTSRRGCGCHAAGAHLKARVPGPEMRDYLLAKEAKGVEHLLVLRRPDGAE